MPAHAEINLENEPKLFGDMPERSANELDLKINNSDVAKGLGQAVWNHRGHIAGAAMGGLLLAHAAAETALGAPPSQAPTTESNFLVDAIDMFRNHPSKGIVSLATLGAVWGVGWGSIQIAQSAAQAAATGGSITIKGAIGHVVGSIVRESFEWGAIGGIAALGVNYYDKMQLKPFSNEDISVMMAGGAGMVFALRDAFSTRI